MKFFSLLFTLLTLIALVTSTNNYYLSDPKYSEDGAKFTGTLTFKGDFSARDYAYDWTNRNSELLKPIEKLNIEIALECNTFLHIRVTDPANDRWENPYSIAESFKQQVEQCSKKASDISLKDFGLEISEDTENPFFIKYTNPEDGEEIFTTEGTDFLYTDCFIGFAGYLTSNDIFGFGERVHALNLGDGKFTMWPNDTGGIYDDPGTGGYGAMGIHPLGFHKTAKGSFLSLLFNNINDQDVYIKTQNRRTLFEHRTIGGIIDYYITINKSPNEAILHIHDTIGHPMLPPFWSLGFHQCRYGYQNTQEIEKVYQSFTGNEIPIDTFWGDIDILQDYRDFTLNQQNFRNLPNLIEDFHANGYKFVPIVDLGIPIKQEDEFYVRGKELDAFIKSGYTGEDLQGVVWPGLTVFPDFFRDEGVDVWQYGMETYYKTVKYDGIWLDMNEPAELRVDDFRLGEILPEGHRFDPSKNKYANIPYVPGFREERTCVASRSLSENAFSKLIEENKNWEGYNFKPLIAFGECKATNDELVKLGKRPFILSRSTSTGVGRYTFHWLGDNFSSYFHMKNGLNGIFAFNIFGIPMTGDDICGHIDNSWDELCARWMNLGAFFPFSRNHNGIGNKAQDPVAFGRNSKTLPSAKNALKMRYSLLRYYYTELFKISLGESGAFFKPAFFEFFEDPVTLEHLDESAMLGPSLILYPVFKNEEDDIEVYLPNDDWNVYPTGENFKSKGDNGSNVKLSGEFNKIHIFMRGGRIIPYQETLEEFVPNTEALKDKPTELIISQNTVAHTAIGDIIFDDDAVDTLAKKNYFHIKLKF